MRKRNVRADDGARRGRKRWVVSSVVAAAMLLSGSVTSAVASTPLSVPATQVTEAQACPAGAETVDEAARAAVECGSGVPVSGELTEWMTPTATPSGDLTVEYNGSAVRQDSDGDGDWADVDVQVQSTEVVDGELAGMLPVTGGVEPIWLNPGGEDGADLPLAVLGGGDRQVSMYSASLPLALGSVGAVTSDRVTYDFGQGVTLVVSVDPQGTSVVPVVRLADAAALDFLTDELLVDDTAEPFALTFPMEMSGDLDLVETEIGFEIRDSAGEVAFESGPALMWDSAGHETWDGVGTVDAGAGDGGPSSTTLARTAVDSEPDEDRLAAPASGDAVVHMGVEVNGDTVSVVPDAELLADPDLTWPLHLDPKIGAPTPTRWGMVQSHWPSTATMNESGTQAVGLCDPARTIECTASNVQRLFWQFSSLQQGTDGPLLAQLSGSSILSAQFSVYGTHSWDCSNREVRVYGAAAFTTATWNDQPALGTLQDTKSVSHKIECDNRKRVYFDVTQKARLSANGDVSQVPLTMRSAEEGSMTWWKRYQGSSAQLTISYDRAPLAPTASQTDIAVGSGTAGLGCETFVNRPQVRDTTPILRSRASEPDGTNEVQVRFRLLDHETASTFWYSSWSSPSSATTWQQRPVPGSAGLESGKTYRWQVQVKSTDPATGHVGTSSWTSSPTCYFTVDTEYPNAPKVTSSNYPYRQVAGGLGTPIEITFSANGSRDVAYYEYSINSQLFNGRRTPETLGGPVTLSRDVLRPGLNYFIVRSYDDAELFSDATVYEFYVGFPHKTGHWQFNDGGWAAGQPLLAANSLAGAGTGSLNLAPSVEWVPGPTTAYDGLYPPDPTGGGGIEGRVPDGALKFDANTDLATTTTPVVDGDQSYTVSAFLRADEVTGSAAAVSQTAKQEETVDGDYRSSFHLGFSTHDDCDVDVPVGADVACWAFWHVRDNEPDSYNVISRTDVPVVVGQWVHVVGVYNATAKTVQAWACPMYQAQPHQPQPGPQSSFLVDEDGEAVSWNPWNAAGGLRLGSGMKNGSPIWPYRGAVDEVRVYDGSIVDEEQLTRICSGTDTP